MAEPSKYERACRALENGVRRARVHEAEGRLQHAETALRRCQVTATGHLDRGDQTAEALAKLTAIVGQGPLDEHSLELITKVIDNLRQE